MKGHISIQIQNYLVTFMKIAKVVIRMNSIYTKKRLILKEFQIRQKISQDNNIKN